MCRSERPIPETRAQDRSVLGVRPQKVIAAIDFETIYAVPISYLAKALTRSACDRLHLLVDDGLHYRRWPGIDRSQPRARARNIYRGGGQVHQPPREL